VGVVQNDDMPVSRGMDIHLEDIGALLEGQFKRRDGVLRSISAGTPVRKHSRFWRCEICRIHFFPPAVEKVFFRLWPYTIPRPASEKKKRRRGLEKAECEKIK
jgi:hypothetical protein